MPHSASDTERPARDDRRTSSANLSKQAVQVLVPLGFVGFAFFYLYAISKRLLSGAFDQIILEHTPALVGMPICILAALCLVSVLRSTYGNIEFSAAGFSFKGASGPIIMWLLTFIGMVVGLRLLWPLV